MNNAKAMLRYVEQTGGKNEESNFGNKSWYDTDLR